MQVRHIGEQGLLKILQSFCPPDIVGDDAAVLEVTEGYSLVVTTDVLVDGVHFSDRTTTPQDVGWRAVAANLSDLAAMGAGVLGITVGLALPGEVMVQWVEGVYQGMTACLNQYGGYILGGDVVGSPVTSLSITALGEVVPHRVIRRDAAQPGDSIVVTGFHGLSRAGLELLLHPEKGQELDKVATDRLILAHQRPQPRLDVLTHLWEVTQVYPVGGMDSSDGLADAVIQLARCSGVGAQLEYSLIPVLPALNQLVSESEALEWVLYGGEDFELVLCLPQLSAQELVKRLGEGAAIIGKVVAGEGVELIDSSGVYPRRFLSLKEGFQHF